MVALTDMTSSVDCLVSDAVTGSIKTMMRSSPNVTGPRLEYTLVNTCDEYEERWYPASTWACTTVDSVYQDTAKIEGFRHLQFYARGGNSADAQLTLQPPILTRVSTECGSGFERRFVVSTFLSGSHSGRLPEPTSANVSIEHLPEMTVFVRRFQGIACEEKWTYETKQLAEVLSHKEDIRTDFYMTATYDSPFQLISDRNEIWFVKFDRKTSPTARRVLKYGQQQVEVPSMFSWITCFFLGYLSFLMTATTTVLRAFNVVRANWDVISTRIQVVGLTIWNNVSFRAMLRLVLSTIVTLWGLFLTLITGFIDLQRTPQWPKQNKRKQYSSTPYNGH